MRGREFALDVSGTEFLNNTGFQRVKVSIGTDIEFLERVQTAQRDVIGYLDELVEEFLPRQSITVLREPNKITIKDGRLFVATMELA